MQNNVNVPSQPFNFTMAQKTASSTENHFKITIQGDVLSKHIKIKL